MQHLLVGERERAHAEAQEVRRIAREIGSDEGVATADLVSGQARIELGDLDGIDDVERALDLGRKIRSPFTPVGLGNSAVTLFDLGLLDRAFELVAEGHALATRLGSRGMQTWLDVLRLREHYWSGNWDAAVRLADEAIAVEPPGIPIEVRPRTVRAQIRLARDRIEEARTDAAEALAGGRGVQTLQSLHTALATHARVSLAAGDRAGALESVDELIERFVAQGSQQLSASLPDFVVVAVDLDRADAFLDAIATLGKETPWIDAARSYARGEFAAAAAVYADMGSMPDAAYANLRAAQALVEQGRRDADVPLQAALAFYRSVGAMRYVREGEALLAAAS
jgi:tetratricopeptide (TPR) repeat protein